MAEMMICRKGHTLPEGQKTCTDRLCRDYWRDEITGCINLIPYIPEQEDELTGHLLEGILFGYYGVPSYEGIPIIVTNFLQPEHEYGGHPVSEHGEIGCMSKDTSKNRLSQLNYCDCYKTPADLKPAEMPLREQLAKIACLNCDSKDDCSSEVIDKNGDGDCAITRNLMNHINAWLPTHDQQVRQAAVKEFVLEFVDRMINCPTSFMPDQITAIEAVLLVMAEGGKQDENT